MNRTEQLDNLWHGHTVGLQGSTEQFADTGEGSSLSVEFRPVSIEVCWMTYPDAPKAPALYIIYHGENDLILAQRSYHAEMTGPLEIGKAYRITAVPTERNGHRFYNTAVEELQPSWLQVLGQATQGTFSLWMLAGKHNAASRQQIMTLIRGVKVPSRMCGVTAVREAVYEKAGVDRAQCAAAQANQFRTWAKGKVARA